MKIGVIQTAFIGDVILTTPLLEVLSSKYPSAEVYFITTKAGKDVLASRPGLTAIVLDKKNFKKGISEVLKQLPIEPLDLLFCVHRSFRSLYLAKKIRAYSKVSFHSLWAKAFGFSRVKYPAYSEEVHYSDKPLKLISVMCDVPATPRPKLYCASEDEGFYRGGALGLEKKNYLVLSPFSVWGTKMWFADRYARVAAEASTKFNMPIVLVGTGGPRESAVAETIGQKISAAGGKYVNLVNKTTLGQLKVVIRDASLLLSNDSAPIHIAAAFDVPTVAVFGPTVKKWGFFPLSTKSIVIEKQDVACRPCSLHGPMQCPKRHFRCMNEIQVEEVSRAVETLI